MTSISADFTVRSASLSRIESSGELFLFMSDGNGNTISLFLSDASAERIVNVLTKSNVLENEEDEVTSTEEI